MATSRLGLQESSIKPAQRHISISGYIDIRQYQRGYDDEGDEAFYPTKKGFRFPEREFRRVVKNYTLMPETYVHPLVVKKSFSLLNDGQFESAVLQAFKTIETRIREKINATREDYGVKLIRKAFHSENDPLTDFKLPKAERDNCGLGSDQTNLLISNEIVLK